MSLFHSGPFGRPPLSSAWRQRARFSGGAGIRPVLVLAAAALVSLPLLHVGSAGLPGHPLDGPLPVAARDADGPVRRADFGSETPSDAARYLADWIADSGDNAGADFILIDKPAARAYVFDATAQLRAATAVLLGAALGDDSVPGIGLRPLSEVRPAEKTTPAGRFVAEPGHNLKGEDVVWVDYDAAVSLHRVRATNPAERRLERLATPTVADNRISFGCINVPAAFYDAYIRPLFAEHTALVYVLPDTRPLLQVFQAYDVSARARRVSVAASAEACPGCGGLAPGVR